MSVCNMTEYSLPSRVYFVTSFEPNNVSKLLPIASIGTPKSAALSKLTFIFNCGLVRSRSRFKIEQFF